MKQLILVVDDEQEERDAMAHWLRRHHYLVESAANGREALDRLRQGAALPALVLLDLNMPVMDGWAFLAEVAQDCALRDLPVIVISAASAAEIAVRPRLAFVAKPVRPPVIMRVIAAMLQQPAAGAATANDGPAVATDVDTGPHRIARHRRAPITIS